MFLQSTLISVSVCLCLFVCLFVCLSALIYQNKRNKYHEIFVHVTCDRGSAFIWQQRVTLCTTGFVNDVIFSSYNRGNKPESKTTRMFRRVRQAPKAKSAVSDCALLQMWTYQHIYDDSLKCDAFASYLRR